MNAFLFLLYFILRAYNQCETSHTLISKRKKVCHFCEGRGNTHIMLKRMNFSITSLDTHRHTPKIFLPQHYSRYHAHCHKQHDWPLSYLWQKTLTFFKSHEILKGEGMLGRKERKGEECYILKMEVEGLYFTFNSFFLICSLFSKKYDSVWNVHVQIFVFYKKAF